MLKITLKYIHAFLLIVLISFFSFAQQKEKPTRVTKEDEEKFFVPWKNVIKTDLLGLGLTLANSNIYYYGIEYERVFNIRTSFCLQFGYIRPYYEETILSNGYATNLEYKMFYEGFYISPKFRVYVMNKKPKHPRGTFVNFGASYYSLKRKIEFITSNQNKPTFNPDVKLTVGNFIMGVGHQGMIGSRVTLSGGINLNLIIGGKSSENDGFEFDPKGLYPTAEISLGYAFGVN
jgi:hypothetical protein